MCYSRDYRIFDKKAKEAREQQERRTGVIDKLLADANKQGENAKEATPVKDIAPAK